MNERIQELERELSSAVSEYSQREGVALAIKSQCADFTAQAEALTVEVENLDKACALISTYADSRQESIHAKLEELLTQGLTQIFQEDLRFVVRSRPVGKRTEVEFRLITKYGDADVETGIMDARGGGVAAVTGFLLQVVMILLTKAPKVLFVDETFAQVSKDYEPRLAEFLDELVDQFQVQIIMVTHSDAFEEFSDVVYRTSKNAVDGVTVLTKVK